MCCAVMRMRSLYACGGSRGSVLFLCLRLAFRPDGRRIAARGFDKIVRIWEVPELDLSPESAPGHAEK
jgi:hypothetical protein